ncbi:hypothetical protein E1B28_007158 [Marasmius oreades]|uniref:FAD-binding domain-containing protein n=1 Tax=Marasmius oreades TaxID=181124 RepID=A0A9P7UTH7_9AGAR|nr:uncharacterized protein E1B28_007158 [Marasmius oreades]KAG7093483.1 hypothetical protein E1B28_007158 [Marasmius oreades]
MAQPILIVGAGPVGLVLALSLLQNGVSVRIINKQLSHPVGHRGSGLQPRTLELYKLLGILPDIQNQSGPFPPMKVYTSPEGPEPVKEFSMIEDLEATPEYPLVNVAMLSQDRHEALIRDVLAKKYNTHVELGTELRSFVQNRHTGQVEARIVKLVDGNEVEEAAIYDFLIGADGARSVVRKQLGLTFLGESRTEASMIVGDLEVKGLPDRKYWRGWADGQRIFVSLRPWETDGDLYNLLIAGSEVDVTRLASNIEEMIRMINATIGRELEFGDVLCSGIWTPNIRMVDRFGEGRVFVAGDAAHVHSPNGGQGMNSGVQDAINLGWKLSLVQKGLAPLGLLTSYNDERLSIIAVMLKKTTLLLDKTMSVNWKETEDTDMFGFKKGFEMRQLGVNYRGSPIVVDERYSGSRLEVVDPYKGGLDGRVRAGDRAPAAGGLVCVPAEETGEMTTTLFDVFTPSKHSMLVFAKEGRDDSEVEQVLGVVNTLFPEGTVQTIVLYPYCQNHNVAGTRADWTLVDKEGYAFKHYHYSVYAEDRWKMVVVRPDAYIGAIVEGEEGLREYVKLVFGTR